MERANRKDILKFIILSMIGIFMYFIPVSRSKVPVVILVGFIKNSLGHNLNYLVLLVLAALFFSIIGAKVFKHPLCENIHKEESTAKLIHYSLAFLLCLAVWFKLPPDFIFSHEKIGKTILGLAGTVMLTVAVCGGFIVFILKSGIVEFAGSLMEPLMRPLFKLPGEAAVNMLSSYVVSAAVGVYMSDQYYLEKKYTQREAVTAATCFSTISVGYVGVLCSIGGIEHMYGTMLALTFLLVFVMTIIVVRIPPLSRIEDVYVDESKREKHKLSKYNAELFETALNNAALKSREFTLKAFSDSILNAAKFSQKIIAYMIPIVVITLTIVHHTPLFEYLGKPLAPVLSLLGLPDASKIAPSVLLGFIEVSLPAISVSTGVAAKSVFFIILLSIIQIVFMTEAGNAMLGARFSFKFKDCVIHFLVRTIIAIPIIALTARILYG